jgi:hypothetical protein
MHIHTYIHSSEFEHYFPLVREKLEREEQARQSAFKARMDSLEQSAKKYDLKVGSKIQVSSHTYIHTYIRINTGA